MQPSEGLVSTRKRKIDELSNPLLKNKNLESSRLERPNNFAPVRWPMLSDSLQAYVFGHLLLQLRDPTLIARKLGLLKDELLNALYILKQQKRHPLTVDQLYNHCKTLGDGTGKYVDPVILKQYMCYFEFASNFDAASLDQRAVAYQFLRQHHIRGYFVEALLEEVPLSRPQLSLNPDDVAEPENAKGCLSKIRFLIQSIYFPPAVRGLFLSKSRKSMTATEIWLKYQHPSSDVRSKHLTQTRNLPTPSITDAHGSARCVLSNLKYVRQRLLGTMILSNDEANDLIDAYILQLIVTYMAQLPLIQYTLASCSISTKVTKHAFAAAKGQLAHRLFADLKGVISRHKLIAESDLTGEDVSKSTIATHRGRSSERNATTEGDVASGLQPITDITKLVFNNNTVRSRSQSQSTASFHTAQDVSEEMEKAPASTLLSPNRPDYSPLNSDDESSDTEHTTMVTTIPIQFPRQLQHRYTPWKSSSQSVPDANAAPAHTPITAFSMSSIQKQTLLAGIEHAANPPEDSRSPPELILPQGNNASASDSTYRPYVRKLTFKPLVEAEMRTNTPSTSTGHRPAIDPGTGRTPRTSTPLLDLVDGTDTAQNSIKRAKVTRKDKGQKRGSYKKRKPVTETGGSDRSKDASPATQ